MNGSVSYILRMITIICWSMTLLEYFETNYEIQKCFWKLTENSFLTQGFVIVKNLGRQRARQLKNWEYSTENCDNNNWDFLNFPTYFPGPAVYQRKATDHSLRKADVSGPWMFYFCNISKAFLIISTDYFEDGRMYG